MADGRASGERSAAGTASTHDDALDLQLREAQLRGIFDSASEGILTVDASQTIVMANRAAAAMFGIPVGELLGSPLERLLPERSRARHAREVAAFGQAEAVARTMGERRELHARRADGTEFPIAAGISQAHVDGVRLFTVILHDLGEAQRTAAALHTSEQLIAATFGVSSVGMVQLDPATQRFVATNAAFCAICGYEEAELLGLHVDRLNHPQDPLDGELFAALLEGRAGYDLDKRLVRKDGRSVWVHVGASVIRDARGRPLRVVGVVQDITARREAEDALRAREARQSFLVRLNDRLRPLEDPQQIAFEAACLLGEFVGAARVGYAEDDGDGQTITLVRNYTNGVPGIEGRYRYLDYGPELLEALRAGRTVVRPDIARDPSLTAAEKAAHAALQLGATVNVPLFKGGQLKAIFFVHASAARDWTAEEVALFEEVAERLRADIERARAEAEVRAMKAQLETALASMNDAVVIADAQGRLIDCNAAFVAFHRCHDRRDCPTDLGRWPDLLEVRTADGAVAPLPQWPVPRALRGEVGSNVEYGLRRKDTGQAWTGSYSYAPIRDAAGGVVGAVVTARDVTDLERMRSELEDSHAQLQRLVEAQNRVQEQERLRIARELHDDMQQSLAAIIIEASVLRNRLDPVDAPAREALARIAHIGEQAIVSTRRIIHDLRPQALEDLGLAAALRGLAQQFSQRTGIACTVDTDRLAPAQEQRLAALGTCLYRVTQEALNNVSKHANAQAVRIDLAGSARQPLRLSIADDGAGLPAGGLPSAEAFGLVGMRERVRAVGGTLRIHGEPGHGTRIEAEFPPPTHATPEPAA